MGLFTLEHSGNAWNMEVIVFASKRDGLGPYEEVLDRPTNLRVGRSNRSGRAILFMHLARARRI